MPVTSPAAGDFDPLARALYAFIKEVGEQRAICLRHRDTAAIHPKGKTLQVYRMFERDANAIGYLRDAAAALPSWDLALLADWEGDRWNTVKNQIDARVRKHPELHEVVSRGVAWKGQPVCIHAYKFDGDPAVKVELAMPGSMAKQPERALRTVAESLECHEFLLPETVAKPKPPYAKHEADLLTIDEYLLRTLPQDMYNLYASNLDVTPPTDHTPPHTPRPS